jgi:hypothetical protein
LTPEPTTWGATDWIAFISVIAAALAGILLIVMELEKRFLAPKRLSLKREAELNDPIDVHFLVPPLSQGDRIEYAEQDGREHLLYDVFLPPHSETIVELRINPKIRFVSTSFLFGCLHDEEDRSSRERKPRPIQLVDSYGQGILSPDAVPGETLGHVTNARHEYRWNQEIRWNYLTIIIGVQIKTFCSGEYLWQVRLMGEEKEVIKDTDLSVIVTEDAGRLLQCVNQEHEGHSVAPILGRKSGRS